MYKFNIYSRKNNRSKWKYQWDSPTLESAEELVDFLMIPWQISPNWDEEYLIKEERVKDEDTRNRIKDGSYWQSSSSI